MNSMRRTVAFVAAFALISAPTLAQQAQAPASDGSRAKFWTGTMLGIAGGTAIVLGSTTLKTSSATSGNTPPGGYDSCVALKSNPVYSGNQCDVLKGPNKAVTVAGTVAAATGVALMMMGLSHNSSVAIGPRDVRFLHRLTF